MSGSFLKTAVVCFLAGLSSPAFAQSQTAATATPLQPGPNRGGADSFQGDHLWVFQAQPGSFQLTLREMGRSQDSVPMPGQLNAAIQLVPSSPHSRYTTQKTPMGTVWSGTVDRPTKVYILVAPPQSSLVRIAINYSLEATGQVAFGGPGAGSPGGDPIVGAYTGSQGAIKFLPDGRVMASNGETGQWQLFDAGTQTYAVVLGRIRYAVKLVPGRGLIDPHQDTVAFTPIR